MSRTVPGDAAACSATPRRILVLCSEHGCTFFDGLALAGTRGHAGPGAARRGRGRLRHPRPGARLGADRQHRHGRRHLPARRRPAPARHRPGRTPATRRRDAPEADRDRHTSQVHGRCRGKQQLRDGQGRRRRRRAAAGVRSLRPARPSLGAQRGEPARRIGLRRGRTNRHQGHERRGLRGDPLREAERRRTFPLCFHATAERQGIGCS